MMPVLRLNDATFAELAAIARWFGAKTPAEAMDRLVRDKALELGMERDSDQDSEESSTSAHSFSNAPGLSFTRLIAARVDGSELEKANWAQLLLATIGALKQNQKLSVRQLVSELQIGAKTSEHTKDGYSFYPDLGISVQGQAAQDAWREIERIAEKWGIRVEVEFEWRQNVKAERPGQRGLLEAGPA